jgi:hypothetical protein
VNLGLSELSVLARRAFEERRRKQCLALTSAILKIDPNHKEALVIQAWVRADLEQDVEKARMLVEEAQARNTLASYDRAEVAVRAIISMEPDNEEAKGLLNEVLKSASNAPRFENGTAEALTAPVPDPAVAPSRVKKLVVPAILVVLLTLAVIAGVMSLGVETPLETAVGSEGAIPTGTLEIAMDPGIDVFINDELRGTTPLDALSLDPGAYLLRYQSDVRRSVRSRLRSWPDRPCGTRSRLRWGDCISSLFPGPASVCPWMRGPSSPCRRIFSSRRANTRSTLRRMAMFRNR